MTGHESHEELQKLCIEYETKINHLEETLNYLMKRLYGSKSEKSEALGITQLSLFDESEIEANADAYEPLLEDKIKTTNKYKGQKEDKLRNLPHEKEVFDLPIEDRICSTCGSELKSIGEEFVRSEVVFQPARLRVVDYYVKTYECRKCKNTDDAIYVTAGCPSPVIPHSIASASSVAYVMYQKFVNHVPLYRQEAEWQNYGLKLSRQTMANWVIIAATDWLAIIFNKLHEALLKEKYCHADETRIQVLNEIGRDNTTQSFMWVFGTIKETNTPIRLFEYSPTRNGDTAKDFLNEFNGMLITDAYGGYEKVENVTRCYCWAHCRRYFVDALPKDIQDIQDTAPVKAIDYCNKLFAIEKEIDGMSAEDKKKVRQEKSKPLVDAFLLWIDENQNKYMRNSKLGKAFSYTLNQKEGLIQFLNDGNIPLSNNIAENAIRPFTVGRKNWLFAGSPNGAKASAIVYSIIETAKANQLNPFKYLNRLMSELPGLAYDEYPDYLNNYMPWSEYMQLTCGIKEKLTDNESKKS